MIKKGGKTSQHHSKSFEEICRFFNDAISEEDLDKWGEVSFKVRRAKEMEIAPIAGVMEVEMIYGNNIMRTRIQRAT
jgi:hypothetical protein